MAIQKKGTFRRRSGVSRIDLRAVRAGSAAAGGPRGLERALHIPAWARLPRWFAQGWPFGRGPTVSVTPVTSGGQPHSPQPEADSGRIRAGQTVPPQSLRTEDGNSARHESADSGGTEHSPQVATFAYWYRQLQAEKAALYRQIDWIEEAQAALERCKGEALRERFRRSEAAHVEAEEDAEEVNESWDSYKQLREAHQRMIDRNREDE